MSTEHQGRSAPPKPPSAEMSALTPEKLRELLAEGRALRAPLEQRLTAMQTVSQESLVARAK